MLTLGFFVACLLSRLDLGVEPRHAKAFFQDIPGTNMEKNEVQKWLKDLASDTDRANEQLESCKAVLKARGL